MFKGAIATNMNAYEDSLVYDEKERDEDFINILDEAIGFLKHYCKFQQLVYNN